MGYHGEDDFSGVSRKKACTATWKHMRAWAQGCKTPPVFIGMGASGISYACAMSMVSGLEWAFIRKENDIHHHGEKVHSSGWSWKKPENHPPLVFTDDFVSAGTTLKVAVERLVGSSGDMAGTRFSAICLPMFLEYSTSTIHAIQQMQEYKDTLAGIPIFTPKGLIPGRTRES